MTKITIDNKTRQYVRSRLYKYNEYKKDIQEIRQSIMTPWKESDENIGGGRSSLPVFEVEEKAFKLISNEQLAFRTKFLYVVDTLLAKCNDEVQKIIEMKYFAHESNSWVKIASEVGYSEDGCRKIERKFIDSVAEKIGL